MWSSIWPSDVAYAPVVINEEAPSTRSPQVHLYIHNLPRATAMPSPGPATDMMVANNPQFAGASWEPFRAEKEWGLEEGTGWRTVYVKTRDRLGRMNDRL